MELIKNRIGSYSATTDIVTLHEESLDSIVPDTFADIEQILCCFGNVEIKEKTAQTDRVMISGSINATMVYSAENDDAPICLSASIPFAALVEAKGARPQDTVCVQCKLQKIEGIILNPRKHSIKAQIAMDTRVYSKCENEVCSGVRAEACEGVQTLIEDHTFRVISCVREKSLMVREDVRAGGDCAATDKILSTASTFMTEDVRVVSNKVMLRGSVKNDVITMLEDGTTAIQSFTLPYSQIIEVDNAETDDDANVVCCARYCNIELGEADNGAIFKCEVAADVVVCITREMTYPVLSDGFSTVSACKMERAPLLIGEPNKHCKCSTEVKETIETSGQVQSVIDASICATNIHFKGGEAHATICANVIYKSVNGCLSQSCQAIAACATCPEICGDICNVLADCNNLSVICNAGALILCGTVNFTLAARSRKVLNQVCAWEIDGNSPIVQKTSASLILRRAQNDETVWKLARDYNTSVGEIRSANRLEENDAIAAGKLVMIPFSKI